MSSKCCPQIFVAGCWRSGESDHKRGKRELVGKPRCFVDFHVVGEYFASCLVMFKVKFKVNVGDCFAAPWSIWVTFYLQYGKVRE